MSKRKTTEEFIKKVKNIHGSKYDYSFQPDVEEIFF
jgi:hypothetical protein